MVNRNKSLYSDNSSPTLHPIKIIQAGPMTTLQDLGRQGGQRLGFCQSGAADEYSFLWANKLLDNDINSAALEISFGPFICHFEQATLIAITGTKCNIQIKHANGECETTNSWRSIYINAGDTIKIQLPESGVFTYLAIKRGFQLPAGQSTLFGSVAMAPREQSGPFAGKAFTSVSDDKQLNKTMPLYYSMSSSQKMRPQDYYSYKQQRGAPWNFIPDHTQTLQLGLIPAYQASQLEPQVLESIFRNAYRVAPDSNKMGYRLEGPTVTFPKSQLLSEGIAFGAVQVTPEGQLIILLKDRQTIGGYPKIGSICLLDAFRLSQRRPGQEVWFYRIGIENGALEKSYDELRQWQIFFGHTRIGQENTSE